MIILQIPAVDEIALIRSEPGNLTQGGVMISP